MVEVVDGPRRDQLLERDDPEVRVTPLAREVRFPERAVVEPSEVRGAELGEPVEDVADRPSHEPLEAGLPIHRPQHLVGAVLEDRVDPPDPVVLLDVGEVRERLPRRPRPLAFVRRQPPLGQAGERRAQRGRRPLEDLSRLREIERHRVCVSTA
jgi:hypothetical protein